MDHAFAKLKKNGSVTLESENYNQILTWEKAFIKKLGPYSFYEILVTIERARSRYYIDAKLEKIKSNIKPIKRKRNNTSEVSEEQALINYHALCDGDPIAKSLIKELYEAGMIPGIRSIVSVKRIAQSSKNGLYKTLGKKNETVFGTKSGQRQKKRPNLLG